MNGPHFQNSEELNLLLVYFLGNFGRNMLMELGDSVSIGDSAFALYVLITEEKMTCMSPRLSKCSVSHPGICFHPPKLGPHCSPILISSILICLKNTPVGGNDIQDPGGGDRRSRIVTL